MLEIFKAITEMSATGGLILRTCVMKKCVPWPAGMAFMANSIKIDGVDMDIKSVKHDFDAQNIHILSESEFRLGGGNYDSLRSELLENGWGVVSEDDTTRSV